MPEEVRHEHSGNERISAAVPSGRVTIPRRQELLAKKQEELRASIRELEDSIAYIDFKQDFYRDVRAGKIPYVSNLIPTAEDER